LWSSIESDTTPPYEETGSGGSVLGGSSYVTSCAQNAVMCDNFTGAYVDFDNHYIDQLNGSNDEQWNTNTSNDDWLITGNQLQVDETGVRYLYADLEQADFYCVLNYSIADGSANNFQGIIFRWSDADNYFRVGYNPYLQKLQFWKHLNGSDELLSSKTVSVTGSTVTLEVNVSGIEFEASTNGSSPLEADSVFNQSATNIGVYNWRDISGTLDPVYFDSVDFFDARILEWAEGGSIGSGSSVVTVNHSPQVAISASSTIAGNGTATHIPVTYNESTSGGVLSGSQAALTAIQIPSSAISGTSSVSISPLVVVNTIISTTGTSGNTALPTVETAFTTQIDAESTVSTIPTVGIEPDSTINSTSEVTIQPLLAGEMSSSIAGTGTLNALPSVAGDVDASIDAVSTLNSSKTRTVQADSALNGTSSATINPQVIVNPESSVDSTSVLAVSGTVQNAETTSINGSSTVSALPAVVNEMVSTISGSSSLNSSATLAVLATGSVDSVSSLVIVPQNIADQIGSISGTSAFSVLPTTINGDSLAIAVTSSLNSIPKVQAILNSSINGTSSLTPTAMLILDSESDIDSTTELNALPSVEPILTASIDAISALIANGGFRPKSIVQELGDYLQETSAITDIASDIYVGYLPEDVTLPAIVYTRIKNNHINQLDDLAGVMEASILIECYSYSYLTNRTLMKALRNNLSSFSGLMGSVNIDSIDFGEPLDSIEKMKEGSNKAIYKTTINLTVYHNENVAELV